jgi:putative CRISPR-associated protein (TIGR02619 family)
MRALKEKNPARFLPDASAELNVLAGMRCGRQDEVCLLVSETDIGRAAGELVGEIIKTEIGCSWTARSVAGLQIQDARRFRLEGIPNLLRRIQKLRGEAAQRNLEPVLNINGGFKSVLPFAALYGMMLEEVRRERVAQ